MSPLPQRCTLPAYEKATLHLSLLPLLWPLPLQSPLPSLLSLPTPLPLLSLPPIAVAIGHFCCSCHQPSLLPSLLHCSQPLPLPLAIAISVTISQCICHLCWPALLPSPLAISECCCLGVTRIVFDQLKQKMLTLFCSESGRRTEQSRC